MGIPPTTTALRLSPCAFLSSVVLSSWLLICAHAQEYREYDPHEDGYVGETVVYDRNSNTEFTDIYSNPDPDYDRDHGINEKEVLLELYRATGGESWNVNKGWANEWEDLCDWYGVICEEDLLPDENEDARRRQLDNTDDPQHTAVVIGLDLADNFLTGRTPTSLWSLPRLQYVSFSYNVDLKVNVAKGNSETLQYLKMHNTATATLSGIDGFVNLKSLHVSGAPLGAAIPAEFFSLTKLEYMHMAHCDLQGTIPTEMAQLSLLKQLNVFDNELSGSIPSQLGTSLMRLQVFSVSKNQLYGPIPATLNEWTHLEELYLGDNQLSGSLPSLANMYNLRLVFMDRNKLSGSIPSDFLAGILQQSNDEEVEVRLNTNQLTGIVPASLDQFEGLPLLLDLTNNQFEAIDESLCDNYMWNEGRLEDYECDGLLCPIGTFNERGFRRPQDPCYPCESALYMGAHACMEANDYSALIGLFKATNGRTAWFNTSGWGETDVDICEWYGIECWVVGEDMNGRVRKIVLDDNGLEGTIPAQIFSMDYLHTLSVSRNDVVLPFTKISDSDQIRHIDISQTLTTDYQGLENADDFFAYLFADRIALQGSIPSEVYSLTTLRILSMAECELVGTLRDALGDMASLTELYLYGNALRGTLPSTMGGMSSLRILSLAQNQLTGTIPESLQDLRQLQAVSLKDQKTKGGGFTGSVPAFRSNLDLTSLYLGGNKLTGPIPERLLEGGDLETTFMVDLSNNELTGTAPGALSRFSYMNIFLEGNRLSAIDDSLCQQSDWNNGLVAAYQCEAILCPAGTSGGRRRFGAAPCRECLNSDEVNDFLGQVTCSGDEDYLEQERILQLLYTSSGGNLWVNKHNWLSKTEPICNWFGIRCDETNSIVSLTLGANNLRGKIPTELYQLTTLEILSLFSNDIEISFDGIENADSLVSLMLDQTGLKSLEGIGAARSLHELNVNSNRLEGTIPEELGRLVNLESLSLSGNRFAGRLPSFLASNFPNLKSFLAAWNDLSGPLLGFESLTRMNYLDVSHNALTGTVPSTLLQSASTTEKVVVDLSHNQLGGTLSVDLARLNRLTLHLNDNLMEAIDEDLCDVDGWNDYAVRTYGCNAILCPMGTSNKLGRETEAVPECEPCSESKYMGSTACSSAFMSRRQHSWTAMMIGSLLVTMAVTTGLL